jgi:hypothetical protein
MKINKHIKVILIISLFITVGTLGCDPSYNRGKKDNKPLLSGVGCLTTSPITMKSTTYDLDNKIISANKQQIMNMSVQNTQPSMLNMYEMYAGVQLEMDMATLMKDMASWSWAKWLDFFNTLIYHPDEVSNIMMAYVKQTPLLTQFWALNQMESSINAGKDGVWMTADDTIDPNYGYFVTTHDGNRYSQIKYSDFGVTPSSRVDYIVEDNKKTKTYIYEAGTDGKFGTDDDLLVRTTVFKYNSAGKLERAISYTDDEVTFENVYVFTYDDTGRLQSMYSYKDQAETTRLAGGSYSILTWGDTEGNKTLDITLGLRLDLKSFFMGERDIPAIIFHYEFNEDGTIHKMIQYKPMKTASDANIDTCYMYVYSGSGFLSMGHMNDESKNYSDNETTQKSHTVNEINIGIQTE